MLPHGDKPDDRSGGGLTAFSGLLAAGAVAGLGGGLADRPEAGPMPASSATMRTASGNATPFRFITSAGASPPRLQGQHRHVPRCGSTSNDGSWSSWNGQGQSNRRRCRLAAGPSNAVATRARSTRPLMSFQSIRSPEAGAPKWPVTIHRSLILLYWVAIETQTA